MYFERMKEEVRHGRTIRNSALRSFKATWRTIVAADLVALIAAVVLFLLSVGSVRGFALYLGVTTVCDLIVCFFFTRPAVGLLAESGWLDRGDTFGLKELPMSFVNDQGDEEVGLANCPGSSSRDPGADTPTPQRRAPTPMSRWRTGSASPEAAEAAVPRPDCCRLLGSPLVGARSVDRCSSS